jgi:uncharacterized membrane protein YeaQ/YmgE (transglycosylase-associated protein family)
LNIISWLVVGLIAGWLAGQIMRGGGYGLLGDIVVGIVGALLGGFLAAIMFGGDYLSGINLSTILVAFLGSIVFIAILRMLPGGRRV